MATTHETQRAKETDGKQQAAANESPEPRGLHDLLKQFTHEVTALIREEMALARTETSEKITRVSRNSAYLATGAIIAFAGLIVLLFSLGEGIAAALIAAGMEANALWLGPLIVGLVVAAIGGGLMAKAKSTLKKESVVPEKTKESLKENKEWLRHKKD